MNIGHLIVATLAFAIPAMACAGTTAQVPEPDTIALLGVGAVALLIARWRRKK